MLVGVKGRLPTIPEYYMDFINKNVDLTKEPKQCCPFHKEDTPSFSYSAMKKVWGGLPVVPKDGCSWIMLCPRRQWIQLNWKHLFMSGRVVSKNYMQKEGI